jgi:hypothetical protein
MPKALSGEMLADPGALIDGPEHHRFNRRVKARGAQLAGFERTSSQHDAASRAEGTRSRSSC